MSGGGYAALTVLVGAAIERLSEDEAVAAFAPDRAPAEGDVGVAELSGQVLVGPRRGSAITFALDQVFAAAGQPLHLALEGGDPFLLRALAAQGFGIAILPRSLTTLPAPLPPAFACGTDVHRVQPTALTHAAYACPTC